MTRTAGTLAEEMRNTTSEYAQYRLLDELLEEADKVKDINKMKALLWRLKNELRSRNKQQ